MVKQNLVTCLRESARRQQVVKNAGRFGRSKTGMLRIIPGNLTEEVGTV